VAAACVATIALRGATSWYAHPFPGVLVTPSGNVSSIGLPNWSGIEQGLRFPDRILSVDGIGMERRDAARTLYAATERAYALGDGVVHVRVATAMGERNLDLRIDLLDGASWWLYAGCTIFTGALYALAAVIAVSSSPRGVLARTFAKFASAAALYFLTLFDYHTTRTVAPLCFAGFACVPFALASLTLRLPEDFPVVSRFPWLIGALDLVGLSLAVLVNIQHFSGADVTTLAKVFTLLLGGALIAFVVTLGVRYLRARGTRKETLRVLFWATATPYLVVGFGTLVALLSSRGSTAAFFAIPALGLAPVATAIAFVRYNLWGSRALLSRVLTRTIAAAVACTVAVGAGAALATSVGVPFRGALAGAAAGALVSALLVNFVSRAVERSLFPAAAQYKPTIEQLSEELTSITDPREVALAVERTVRRWLPCDHVEFRAFEAEEKPPQTRGPSTAEGLAIPVTFGGRRLGFLVVGSKRGGALFTTDDVDLLNTIANQAALALAHAHSYAELERRRQQQAAAWQIERVALVETVAAEIAHEVRYPINFFRSVFRRGPQDAKLDAEEIDIGCEEVDRLERLVSGLRKVVGHRIERRIVPIEDLVARTEVLLRDVLRGRVFRADVPPDTGLRCDPDQVTQVLVNLVANAVDATAPQGKIGVRWTATRDGAELVVWDDGPGFDGDASRLFAPWFTTKVRGTGLGLAITQRIVRAHGWSVDAVRAEGHTSFLVTIPGSDVTGDRARVASDPAVQRRAASGDERHEDSHRR